MIATKIMVIVVVKLYKTEIHGQISLSVLCSPHYELASGPIHQREFAVVLHYIHNTTTTYATSISDESGVSGSSLSFDGPLIPLIANFLLLYAPRASIFPSAGKTLIPVNI